MEQQVYQIKDFKIGDEQVTVLNENMAVAGYNVKEDLIVEGKPIQMTAANSSTWIKKNGKWVCCMHTETIAGDPFGRDRH
jgi:hypothetical protein